MDRNSLIAFLARSYGDVLPLTSIQPDANGLGVFADQVLAVYAEQAGLSDSWANPLAEYFLLEQLELEFIAMPDRVTVDNDTYDNSKLFGRISARLASLRRRLGWILGDEADDADIGKVVTINTPYLTGGATW